MFDETDETAACKQDDDITKEIHNDEGDPKQIIRDNTNATLLSCSSIHSLIGQNYLGVISSERSEKKTKKK